MSDYEYIKGELQVLPRLENETDKDYFERVTKHPWQKYDYEPDSISEAIYDNNISYYDSNKLDQHSYICVNDVIYKFLSLYKRDNISSFCNVNKTDKNTYIVETYFYNGGTCLEEMLEKGLNSRSSKL